MTQCAPAASAFVTSPEYLIPPSAMIGTLCFPATEKQSFTAVSCGTPAPAMIRVVHIEPGPMPTFIPSTPAFIRSSVASDVATLPAITSTSTLFFKTLIVAITALVCPWAVSITMTSTPALARSSALRIAFSPVPIAAPTRSLPTLSLQAFGYFFLFSISFIVIKPLRLFSLSTIGSFSILYWWRIFCAFSRVVPTDAVMSFSFVIT